MKQILRILTFAFTLTLGLWWVDVQAQTFQQSFQTKEQNKEFNFQGKGLERDKVLSERYLRRKSRMESDAEDRKAFEGGRYNMGSKKGRSWFWRLFHKKVTPDSPLDKRNIEKRKATGRADYAGTLTYKGVNSKKPNSQRRVLRGIRYDHKNERNLWADSKGPRKVDVSGMTKQPVAVDPFAPVPMEQPTVPTPSEPAVPTPTDTTQKK